MVAVGALATGVGVVTDAVRHADDASRAAREGVFTFASFPHALFFGGLSVAVLGVLAVLVGPVLYPATARVTVGRRLLQVAAPLAAVVLIAATAAVAEDSSLGDSAEDRELRGATVSETSAVVDGHDHGAGPEDHGDDHAHDDDHAHGDGAQPVSGGGHGEVIEGTATGDSPCEIAQPAPASPGQVGTGEGGSDPVGEHGHRGMVKNQPLTREETETLAEQMRQARGVIDRYPTVADAEAAGYHISTVYVPCIGAHYTNVGLVVGFDPAKPSELLYDGTNPDSKIVGLSYLVYHPGGPPEGFAGPNDHWHQHNANGGLCLQGSFVVGGEEMSEEDCRARGGQKRILEDIWMVHAWVAPGLECSWGVFAGECPELGGVVGGTAWDDPIPGDDNAGATGIVEQ
jgi:hypothetical protein